MCSNSNVADTSDPLQKGAWADLEKAASGACGHFVWNHAILRTFWVKCSFFLGEDGGTRVDNGELRFYDGDLR